MTTSCGGTTTTLDQTVTAGSGPIWPYHALKSDGIAFPQVSGSRTTVPKLRTTLLTCGNAMWYHQGQNRRSERRTTRTPYGVASSGTPPPRWQAGQLPDVSVNDDRSFTR